MGTGNYSAISNTERNSQCTNGQCTNFIFEVGTLAVDGWAVTFGTAMRGLGGALARPGPSLLYQT